MSGFGGGFGSGFGQSQQPQQSAFGQQPQKTTFGQTSTFGQQQQPQQQTANTFGAAPAQSGFGGFGQQPQQQPQQSTFGQPQQQQQGGFGSQQPQQQQQQQQLQQTQQQAPPNNPNNDHILPVPPSSDTISSLHFSPTQNSTLLCGTNWDGSVRLWDCPYSMSQNQWDADAKKYVQKPQFRLEAKLEQKDQDAKPMLCSSWNSQNGSQIYTGNCDGNVRVWDLTSNQSTVIGKHNGPVSCINYIKSTSLVVSAGLQDGVLNFWDVRSPQKAGELKCEDRIYKMDCKNNNNSDVLVCALAGKKIQAYTLTPQPQLVMTMESTLKYQIRSISLFNNNGGFALGSIEGRVAIHYFTSNPSIVSTDNFAFRCHRHDNPSKSMSEVYPVNDIIFHPVHGTFGTVGGDGVVTFWDKDSKQRLKALTQCTTSTGAPDSITCGDFSEGGNMFAYGRGYDWSAGYTGSGVWNEGGAKGGGRGSVWVHWVQDEEVKKRDKTKKK